MVQILPSLLAVHDRVGEDLAALTEAALAVQAAGAKVLHIDVMAPPFVARETFRPEVLPKLRAAGVTLLFDVHLMTPLAPYGADWAMAGANRLTVHPKMATHSQELGETFALMQTLGIETGLALDADEELEALTPWVAQGLCRHVLVMTVKAGAGGQAFQPALLAKAQAVRARWPDVEVTLDGGVNAQTLPQVRAAEVARAVAGSAVFVPKGDVGAAYQAMAKRPAAGKGRAKVTA